MLDHLSLSDGGRLDYFREGDGDQLLVFHHGTPAAGPIPGDVVAAATANGFTIAELVRPGYGQSTRHAGRRVADVAPLVAALADHLGHERFVTMGHSGGGPHAIATAALLPDRCMAAMSLAGVAPFRQPDLDFLAGMGQDNIDEFGAALAGAEDLASYLSAAAEHFREVTADQIVEAMSSLLPDVDRAHLTGTVGEELAAQVRWSLGTGMWGWFDDDVAFIEPWGFDLAAVTRPVQIWQGSDDLMVPFAHGQWLAANVSGAEAHLIEGEGHLSLMARSVGPAFAALRSQL